jgi:hypothetical protein
VSMMGGRSLSPAADHHDTSISTGDRHTAAAGRSMCGLSAVKRSDERAASVEIAVGAADQEQIPRELTNTLQLRPSHVRCS